MFGLFRRFAGDAKASMTTQVVVFSVMLFGTSGVVLDFGRVYSEHSQMQSFTDQAALAAASELDREADSITRAISSVFGDGNGAPMTKSALFSEGEGNQFNISHLFFLRDLSDDDGPQYDITADMNQENLLFTAFSNGTMSGSAELAAVHARYVVAVAEERSVRNSLMRLINSTGTNTVQESNSVRTVAAAKRQTLSCGEFSNLVMCNPWEETDTATSDLGVENFEAVLSNPDFRTLQFSTIADGQIVDGQMTSTASLARRLDLQGSAAVNQICSDPLTLPGYSPTNTAAQNETARVICMLAAAQADEFCEAEELKFVPAEPEVVATALNTAFDMWDEPIASVLAWDLDADGDHSQEVDASGNSVWGGASHPLRDMSPLFQPDNNILKGRVFHEPTAIANAALGIPASSRRNYVPAVGANRITAMLTTCIRNAGSTGGNIDCYLDEDGNVVDYIGDTSRSDIGGNPTLLTAYYNDVYNTIRNYQGGLNRATGLFAFNDLYLEERGEVGVSEPWSMTATGVNSPAPPNFLPLFPHFAAGSSLVDLFHAPGPLMTLQNHFAREDGLLSSRVSEGNSVLQVQRVPDYDDITGQPLDNHTTDPATGEVSNAGASDGVQDLRPAYPNYTYTGPVDGGLEPDIDWGIHRRVFDVTLINCGAATVNDDGENVAPIAGYAKMILMTPPQVECPDGTENCSNDQLTSTMMITEFVGSAEPRTESFAVLVR